MTPVQRVCPLLFSNCYKNIFYPWRHLLELMNQGINHHNQKDQSSCVSQWKRDHHAWPNKSSLILIRSSPWIWFSSNSKHHRQKNIWTDTLGR
jgi:hypothetical protein